VNHHCNTPEPHHPPLSPAIETRSAELAQTPACADDLEVLIDSAFESLEAKPTSLLILHGGDGEVLMVD
jgi:hypothetical protein